MRDASVLRVMLRVARLFQDQGRFDEAAPLFQRTIEGYEATLGPTHHRCLAAVTYMAGLAHAQGKLDEVVPLFQRAMDGYGLGGTTYVNIKAELPVTCKSHVIWCFLVYIF